MTTASEREAGSEQTLEALFSLTRDASEETLAALSDPATIRAELFGASDQHIDTQGQQWEVGTLLQAQKHWRRCQKRGRGLCISGRARS